MNKRLTVLVVMFIVFCSLSTAHAWLRDANIAFSRDCVGIGWYEGLAFTAEKIVDKETSIGFYALPTVASIAGPVNMLQLSYNKQVIGKEEDGFAFTYYLGMVYSDYYINTVNRKMGLLPDIGMAFRWRLNESSVLRMHTFLYVPFLIEYGYKYNKDLELALGIGYPFQLVSLRYLF